MKLSDLVELAKAGYKFAEVKELLEYVETSPAVQEQAPGITPADVPEHIPEDPKPEPEPKAETTGKEQTVNTNEEETSALDKFFD